MQLNMGVIKQRLARVTTLKTNETYDIVAFTKRCIIESIVAYFWDLNYWTKTSKCRRMYLFKLMEYCFFIYFSLVREFNQRALLIFNVYLCKAKIIKFK